MLTDKERGEIMIAHHRGEPIQCRVRNTQAWRDDEHPTWDWPEYEYRVAPTEGYYLIRANGTQKLYTRRNRAQREFKKFKIRYPEAELLELVIKI